MTVATMYVFYITFKHVFIAVRGVTGIERNINNAITYFCRGIWWAREVWGVCRLSVWAWLPLTLHNWNEIYQCCAHSLLCYRNITNAGKISPIADLKLLVMNESFIAPCLWTQAFGSIDIRVFQYSDIPCCTLSTTWYACLLRLTMSSNWHS